MKRLPPPPDPRTQCQPLSLSQKVSTKAKLISEASSMVGASIERGRRPPDGQRDGSNACPDRRAAQTDRGDKRKEAVRAVNCARRACMYVTCTSSRAPELDVRIQDASILRKGFQRSAKAGQPAILLELSAEAPLDPGSWSVAQAPACTGGAAKPVCAMNRAARSSSTRVGEQEGVWDSGCLASWPQFQSAPVAFCRREITDSQPKKNWSHWPTVALGATWHCLVAEAPRVRHAYGTLPLRHCFLHAPTESTSTTVRIRPSSQLAGRDAGDWRPAFPTEQANFSPPHGLAMASACSALAGLRAERGCTWMHAARRPLAASASATRCHPVPPRRRAP